MPTTRAAGPDALLVEVDGPVAARALHVALLARRAAGALPAVVDVVPAARTVLVVAVPGPAGRATLAALAREVAARTPRTAAADADTPVVDLEVVYDGPDLDGVAALAGVGRETVVARHAAGVYAVAFCGFAPGFAYLTGLPAALHVPRLASPRARVPAGAVGLAGEFCGVYPAPSPGGWQLIGRTDAVLWDPAREPAALLAPGTAVRFVPVPARSVGGTRAVPARPTAGRATAIAPASAVLTVLRAGPLTTVQDLGRPGHAHLGVPPSGAVDAPSLRLTNRLVGNAEGAAGLETTVGGVDVAVGRSGWIAVTGARGPVTVDGRPATSDGPVHAAAGAVVSVGPAVAGVRRYLAVSGGLAVPPVLGSRATDVLSGLGPPPVVDGAVLPLGPHPGAPAGLDVAVRRVRDGPLRAVPGPRSDWFDAEALDALAATAWTVGADSNRVGVRLAGPPLRRARTEELPSEGLVTGALQVAGDGRPVLFLADHPTTGGYPVIAVVAAADVPRAAQARPGDTLRFRVVAAPARADGAV